LFFRFFFKACVAVLIVAHTWLSKTGLSAKIPPVLRLPANQALNPAQTPLSAKNQVTDCAFRFQAAKCWSGLLL
jgi:hypothetical protein